jgi:hypothetical protein
MSDQGEIFKIEKRLKSCTVRMLAMAQEVGAAKQVREYDSERRKNLLAKHVLPHIKAGESAAAAETLGRSDPSYKAEFEALEAQRGASETVIATWEATNAEHDALRSLLSMAKESFRVMEG